MKTKNHVLMSRTLIPISVTATAHVELKLTSSFFNMCLILEACSRYPSKLSAVLGTTRIAPTNGRLPYLDDTLSLGRFDFRRVDR